MEKDQKKDNSTRTKFVIEFEEHQPFDGVADCKFITSSELQKLASELFRGVFADFEGCLFEVWNNQNRGGFLESHISLLFNHGNYPGERVACEIPENKRTGSTAIDFQRRHDHQMRDGDRYYLTADGKDAIESLLTPMRFNHGKIDWKGIVSEWSETNTMMYGVKAPQYTKVSFIDLNNLCRLIFGDKDENGEKVEYQVSIVGAMNAPYPGMMPNMMSNYMLSITRVSEKQIKSLYEKLGFVTSASNVVR